MQIWLREHNRLCDVARADPRNAGLSEEQLFDLVQSVVVAKLQQVVLTEFLPSLGITQTELEGAQRLVNSPDTSTEFSMAYRYPPLPPPSRPPTRKPISCLSCFLLTPPPPPTPAPICLPDSATYADG